MSTPDLSLNPLTEWLARELSWPVYPEQSTVKHDGVSISDFHQQLLRKQDKAWYEEVNRKSLFANQSLYEGDIEKIVQQLAEHNCLIHDPLLCRFLPAWGDACKTKKAILHYSEPLDCALSLQQNWRIPIAVGLSLWESYIIDACKSLVGYEYRLLSSKDIIESQKGTLTPLINWLTEAQYLPGDLTPIAWPKMHHLDSLECSSTGELNDVLQDSQIEILELLEKGAVDLIAARELPFMSANLLEYYGQLRGALEHANVTRETYKSKYLDAENKALESPQADLTEEKDTQVERSHGQPCNVKVQIEGMETLEFSTTIDSPVLSMLRTHLFQETKDQMIYLNYGETGNEALYFMSSNLLTLETELI